MEYEYIKKFYKNRKAQIVYVMGEKCSVCGYNKCNAALELHHLDPSQKDFTLSDNVYRAWENVKIELQKTTLLCANCHREVHAGLIDNSTLVSSYDEAKAEEISGYVYNQKHKKTCICKKCGCIVSYGANYCQNCRAELSRKVERPSRVQLKEDIRNLSMVQVGKKYGVSDNAIRKWCDKYNLPRKVSDIKNYSDEEWSII